MDSGLKLEDHAEDVPAVTEFLMGKIRELCAYLTSVNVDMAVLLVNNITWQTACIGSNTGEAFLKSNPHIPHQFRTFCVDNKEAAGPKTNIFPSLEEDDSLDNKEAAGPETNIFPSLEEDDSLDNWEDDLEERDERGNTLDVVLDVEDRAVKVEDSTEDTVEFSLISLASTSDTKDGNIVSTKSKKGTVLTFIDTNGESVKGRSVDMFIMGIKNEDHTITYSCKLCDFKLNANSFIKMVAHVNTHLPPENLLSCKVCGKKFSDKYKLQGHSKRHKERPFLCPVCKKTFPGKQAMERHKWIHNTEFTCKDCDKMFTCFKKYKQHMSIHEKRRKIEAADDQCECQICGKVFVHRALLKTHKRTCYEGENKYSCDECDLKFATPERVERHKDRVHVEDWQKCEICGKRLRNKLTLQGHMRSHRQTLDLSERTCKVCDKVLKTKDCLTTHMIGVHGEPRYQCKTCGCLFTLQRRLAIHEQMHTGVRPFKCQFCPKAFKFRHHLSDHENHHTKVRKYVCDICGKEFLQDSSLRIHIKGHRGIVNRSIGCRYCKQKLSNRNLLLSHVSECHQKEDLAHNNPILKKCTICGKIWKKSDKFRDHMDMHAKIKRHICAECGGAFSSRNNLKAHEKSVHKQGNHACTLCGKLYNSKIDFDKHLENHPVMTACVLNLSVGYDK